MPTPTPSLKMNLMIRLFRNVWLLHEDEVSHNPQQYDWTTAAYLAQDVEKQSERWQNFLDSKDLRVVCNDEDFCTVLFTFWNSLLKQFHKPQTQDELWHLYLLDLYLSGNRDLYEKLKHVNTVEIFIRISKFPIANLAQKIQLSDLGFEILLPNYLLNGKGKKELLLYVRWCCWSLLASELQLFLDEIKTDIFSGQEVLGHKNGLYSKDVKSLVNQIRENPSWILVEDEHLLEIFSYQDADQGIQRLKQWFPTAESMLIIFNNHARAHRDEQGINSFAEPIRLIYADQYEELLHRDMKMDFRITYASEHLDDQVVSTIISKIYRSVRESTVEKNSYLKNYELVDGF